MLDSPDVTAIGDANHYGERLGALMARCELRELGHDLVKRGIHKTVELNFTHRPVAAHRQTDCCSHNPRLRQRSINDPVGAKLLLEALGHSENAAELRNVLTHEHHRRIGGHGSSQAFSDGFRQRVVGHSPASSKEAKYVSSASRSASTTG